MHRKHQREGTAAQPRRAAHADSAAHTPLSSEGPGTATARLQSRQRAIFTAQTNTSRRAEECKMLTSSQTFAVCNDEQRAAGMELAKKLHAGAALRASPCDLWPYLRGRTLWLIGCGATGDG
jgi:hypothetical protein